MASSLVDYQSEPTDIRRNRLKLGEPLAYVVQGRLVRANVRSGDSRLVLDSDWWISEQHIKVLSCHHLYFDANRHRDLYNCLGWILFTVILNG